MCKKALMQLHSFGFAKQTKSHIWIGRAKKVSRAAYPTALDFDTFRYISSAFFWHATSSANARTLTSLVPVNRFAYRYWNIMYTHIHLSEYSRAHSFAFVPRRRRPNGGIDSVGVGGRDNNSNGKQ